MKSEDKNDIRVFAMEEFNEAYTSVILSTLKTFIELGARPEEKVLVKKDNKLLNKNSRDLHNAWHFVVEFPLKELINFFDSLSIPVDEPDVQGNTPFMKYMNTMESREPCVSSEYMFSFFKLHKVEIDRANSDGDTPFLTKVITGNASLALQLLDEGANVNTTNKRGIFALKTFVIYNNLTYVKLLLEKYKAQVDNRDNELRTCLHFAINNASPNIDSDSDMENLLLSYGANINAVDYYGKTPLHYCFAKIENKVKGEPKSYIDPIETLSTLCSRAEIKIDLKDNNGKTPLHYAAQRGAMICSTYLLNRGAELEAKDYDGNTPLTIAFISSHLAYAVFLIEKNANIFDSVYYNNRKASLFSIGLNHKWHGMLYILLDKKCDYIQAMEDALVAREYRLLLKLLKRTTDDTVLQKLNTDNQNLIHILIRHSDNRDYSALEDIYNELKRRGVDYKAKDNYGRTALHYAAEKSNYNMLNLLLTDKCDINVIDLYGHTPLTLLVKDNGIESRYSLIELLLLKTDKPLIGKL